MRRVCRYGAGPPCERCHWGCRWNARHWGLRSAVLSGEDACEHRHWGLRWRSLWGNELLYWVG
eukprot:6365359-Pyramimonas_sp.AAC.1